MAQLSPMPKLRFCDSNGDPLIGGKLYTYAAGTTTPMVTYNSSTAASENTNPVILDARGEASVWLNSERYKFVLKTAADVTIWTVDGIQASPDQTFYSITDFGAVAGGADCSAAVLGCLNAIIAAGKGAMYIPAGDYNLNSQVLAAIADSDNGTMLTIYGDGPQLSRLLVNNTDGGIKISCAGHRDRLFMFNCAIEPVIDGSGVGFWWDAPELGEVDVKFQVTLDNVNFTPRLYWTSDGAFTVPLRVYGVYRPQIRNCTISAGYEATTKADMMVDVSECWNAQLIGNQISSAVSDPSRRTITSAVRATNVVTITTKVTATNPTHGLTVANIGDTVLVVVREDQTMSGAVVITGVPSTTTFTYANTGANATVTANNAGIMSRGIAYWTGGAEYGVYHYSTRRRPEGIRLRQNNIVGADVGVYVRKSGSQPQVVISDNHINCQYKNVHIDGCKYGEVSNNLFYTRLTNETDDEDITIDVSPGIGTFYDVYLENADGLDIRENGYRGGANPQRRHVWMEPRDPWVITAISQANPGVVTYTGPDPVEGQRIYLRDVQGMTQINNTTVIATNVNTGSNTFQLYTEAGTAINTTSYSAWTSGGGETGSPVVRNINIDDDRLYAQTLLAPYYVGAGVDQVSIRLPDFIKTTDYADYPTEMVEVDAAASGVHIERGRDSILADGTSDDLANLTRAITQANAGIGSGIVNLPAGTIMVSDVVDILTGVTLVGAGIGKTIIMLMDNSDNHVVRFAEGVNDAGMRDLTINGNKVNQTTGHGIRLGGNERINLTRVESLDARSYGIGIEGGTNRWIKFDGVIVRDCGNDGIDIKNLNDLNFDIQLVNCSVSGWASYSSNLITGITAAKPPVITYTGDDPANGSELYISEVAGMTEINFQTIMVANVNTGSNTFEAASTATANVLAITGISQANPGVVTYTGTDPSNGDFFWIKSVGGMTQMNNRVVRVANVNAGANTFELQTTAAVNIDTSAYTTYTSGGTANKMIDASAYTAYTYGGRLLDEVNKAAVDCRGPVQIANLTVSEPNHDLVTGVRFRNGEVSTNNGVGGHTSSMVGFQIRNHKMDDPLTITAVSKANPGVVTYSGTDPVDGDIFYVTDILGMTELNDQTVMVKAGSLNTTANTFSLVTTAGVNINTSGYTTYTSGGRLLYRTPAAKARGISINGRNVTVADGYILGGQKGVTVLEAGARLSSVTVENTLDSAFLFDTEDGTTGDNSLAAGCHAVNAGNYGFEIADSDNVRLMECLASDCDVRGFSIGTSAGSTLRDCYALSNAQGITITAAATNTKVVGGKTSGNSGTQLLDNGTTSTILDLEGYVTESWVLSGTFAVDSTGVKSLTVAHGLAAAPTIHKCTATLNRNTNVSDYDLDWIRIVSVDATNVTVEAKVETASATGGATAKLAVYSRI